MYERLSDQVSDNDHRQSGDASRHGRTVISRSGILWCWQSAPVLGFGTKRPRAEGLNSGHLALSVLDLIPKVVHVRRADHDWRAAKRPPRI